LEAAEEAREYAESLIETVREPLIVLDADLRVQRATAAFYENFLVSREETEGRQLYDLGNGQWNKPRLRELLGCALFNNEPFHDFEVEHEFPHIGRRTMRLNARRIPRRDPRQRLALLAITDVTERREIAEIRFQRLFETAKDGIVVIDVESETVQDVNPFFLELTGYSREDFVSKPVHDAGRRVGVPQLGAIIDDTRTNEVCRYEDVQITTRDRRQVIVEVVGNRYNVGSQPVIQLNIRDISARKASEEALRSNEERFRLVVESVRDYAIFQLDESGRIVTWNKGAEHVLGWQEPEVIGQRSSVVFTPEDIERGEPERELVTARLHGRSLDERWHVRKDGSRFFASGVLARSPESIGDVYAFTKVMQDITHRKQQDDQLRQSLDEKSMLVREIHHRVKNNLQMIVSLLSLQSSHTADPKLFAAFEETEARVRAIAHIHEQLYASDDLSTVEVGGYVASLARELLAIHSRLPQGIRLQVLTDPLMMHIEKAIPLGLIANELILNSLKHAAPAGKGDVKVTLSVNGNGSEAGWAHLCVEDSGPGLPAGFDVTEAESMGYQLVNLLVEQIRARLHVRPGPGARITVEFPIPKA
jgi:PAS domain S-box-containing protein